MLAIDSLTSPSPNLPPSYLTTSANNLIISRHSKVSPSPASPVANSSGVTEARTKTWVSRLGRGAASANYTCLVINQSGENGSRTIQLEVEGEQSAG